MKLSLIVPCYNEQDNIEPFYELCQVAFAEQCLDYELIFINDGSRDETWSRLKALRRDHADANIKLINFSRNFGKEAAMYAGLRRAAGAYISIIDADCQQRPEVVLEMVKILDEDEDADCVAAYQQKRREGRFLSFCKRTFYRLINRTSEIEFHPNASDFRTFRRTMGMALLEMKECHRFSKGLFSWVGFETRYIPYVAAARNAGKTSWNFGKLMKYAIEGFISFTTFPLRLSTWLGLLSSLAAIIYLIVVVIQRLTTDTVVPGYATIVVLVLLLGGLQLMILGIIGEYLARIYQEGKHRPIYIEKEYLTYEE